MANSLRRITPRISIVIPCYNYGRFLERALKSVISQSYPNLQLIVVDGGSLDSTPSILRKYADHIDVCICEPDDGQADALNKGFSFADGDIFNWLNADDELLPGSLDAVASAWLTGSELIIGKCLIVDEVAGTSFYPRIWIPSHRKYFDFVRVSFSGNLPQPSVFLSRRLASAAFPLSVDLLQVMDYQLYLRCLRDRPRIKLLNQVLANFYYHGSNMSSSSVPKLSEFERVCSAEILAVPSPLLRFYLGQVLRSSLLIQVFLDSPKLPLLRFVTSVFQAPLLFVRPLWWKLIVGRVLESF